VLALLLVATAIGVPDLESPIAEGKLGGTLLSAAGTATATGDLQSRDRWLRAWASLGGRPAAPDGLSAAAEEARRWSKEKGAFRLFGSREGTRLKLGLHDPAGIVTRIEAIGRTADRAVTLPRAEQEADGRMELIIDASLPPDARFEVTTYCDLLAEPMVVRVVTIGGASLAPAAPDPKSLRAAPPRQRVAAVDTMADVGDPLPWWWVVAGVVTLSLVGGAVWQETR